jgi:uncharacterized protein YodC (DUF2158 family)
MRPYNYLAIDLINVQPMMERTKLLFLYGDPMTANLSLGDIVRLNSGGPTMTVINTGNKEDVPTATCVWCSEAGSNQWTIDQWTFPQAALQLMSKQR